VVFIDALMIKIRDGVVTNRAVYVAIGVDCEGAKQVLGLWVGPTTGESAKFWLTVLSELKSRGVADVCIVCCDGLTGLPDAIGVTWPQATVQLCVVHLIRASLRYASRKYWVPLAKDLRLIYTASDEAAAAAALEAFAATWQDRYPAIIKLWRAHWEQFTPFLAFPPEVRRVIYTTNLIESMNARLRKVTRNRGQFPPNRPPSKSSTWRSATWRSSAARTPGSAARGGNRRCKHSRSTSTGESRPHETRHDHLHRRSDAPAADASDLPLRRFLADAVALLAACGMVAGAGYGRGLAQRQSGI
jgi:transposase-like protein